MAWGPLVSFRDVVRVTGFDVERLRGLQFALDVISFVMASSESQAIQRDAELHALIEVMFLVASADGEFSIPERRFFMEMVTSLSDGRLDSGDLLVLTERAQSRLDEGGVEARLNALSALLKDETARRLAYALATQIAFADDEISDAEKQVLDEMARVFELSDEEYEEISSSVSFAHRLSS